MTTRDRQHDSHLAERAPPMNTNTVIAAMCTAVIVIIASVSSLNVTLPSIGSTLSASQSDAGSP